VGVVSTLVDRAGVPASPPPSVVPDGGLPRPPRPPRRWRHPSAARVDAVVVTLAAAAIFALHGYDGTLNHDLGVFTYGGEQVARGVPPYVGIFNSVGPLADLVPGLAIWLGHATDVAPVLVARGMFTLISAACCGLLYVLARDVFGSRPAGFMAPAVFVTFTRFAQLATDGPREKTTMVLLLIGAFVVLGRQYWAAAGALTALATLTWQPSLVAPVAAVVALTMLDRRRWRGALRFTAGGVVTTAVVAAAFAWAGALSRAVQGFILVNLTYTRQPSPLAHPGRMLRLLWSAYGISLPVGALGLVAIIVAGALAAPFSRRCSRRARPVGWRLRAAAAGAAAATAWTLAVMNGPQDPFVLLPFAALGVTGLVVLLLDSLDRRTATALTSVVVALGVTGAGWQAVTSQDSGLLRQRADIAAVLATAPVNATLMSIDVPEVPALADIRDVSSYQLFDPRMLSFLRHHAPGGLHGLVRSVERARPTFVVVAAAYHHRWDQPMLRARYVEVGTGPGWVWFLARSAGPDALAAAHTANATAMGRIG
jgi:hypothetical protein